MKKLGKTPIDNQDTIQAYYVYCETCGTITCYCACYDDAAHYTTMHWEIVDSSEKAAYYYEKAYQTNYNSYYNK